MLLLVSGLCIANNKQNFAFADGKRSMARLR